MWSGAVVLTVVCKATFELRPDLSPLAAEQDAVALAAELTGEHSLEKVYFSLTREATR